MGDSDSRPAGDDGSPSDDAEAAREDRDTESTTRETPPAAPSADPDDPAGEADDLSTEELRARVEEKYDFENFGPADMAEMTPAEWDAAFDPDSWITGEDLLDRVEADLKRRVLDRDVFARVERFGDVVVAYTGDEYAAVYPDGSVEGVGTVRRDVQPSVALCSMESYDVPEVPDGPLLPEPQEVPESGGSLGNTILQVVGGVQIVAGIVLVAGYLLYLAGVFSQPQTSGRGINLVVILVAGIGFLLVGIFMFVVVANARLSDRFRSEEYRDRLRSVGLADGERPEFLAEIDGVELPATARDEGARRGENSDRTDGSPTRRE